MASKLGYFRIDREVKNAEELAEIMKKHFGPKFTVTVGKADKGIKKLFTANDCDTVTVKKNAYHGILMTITPPTEGMEYQAINSGAIVPNGFLNQIVGHQGILDIAICSLIFGKGNDLYDRFDEIVAKELKGARVNMSLKNQIKSAFKGKSVFDTAKDVKDQLEDIQGIQQKIEAIGDVQEQIGEIGGKVDELKDKADDLRNVADKIGGLKGKNGL